jgi:lysine 2,3-aminomutase
VAGNEADMNAAVKQEKSLRSLSDLAQAGLIGRDRVAALQDVAARYAVAITPAVSDLIDPADPADPIARQFVPDAAELIAEPNESADPIGDDAHSPLRGLVHRYPDRVLLKLVSACAVYCRFCFRREMVGPGRGALSADALAAALDYIRAAPQIWEVILTGGDPLILSVRRLARVLDELAAISHVKVMRIHTRVPAVAPERVSPALVRALRAYIKKDKACFVVLHVNHARELGAKARAACARLIDAGIPMLSQTVLLRGVNDETQTLGALMRALVECRIKPYYLHHADLAPGTAHLRTTIAEGQALMRALHGRTSGLCQPSYVLDIPGGHGKSPIGPSYLAADCSTVEDFRGRRHRYPPPVVERQPNRREAEGATDAHPSRPARRAAT